MVPKIYSELELNSSSQLLISRSLAYKKQGDYTLALNDLRDAIKIDGTIDVIADIEDLVKIMNISRDTPLGARIENFAMNGNVQDGNAILKASSNGNKFEQHEILAILRSITTTGEVGLLLGRAFANICSFHLNTKIVITVLEEYSISALLDGDDAQIINHMFNAFGALISNYAESPHFQLQKITFLLDVVFEYCARQSTQTQALKCVLLSSCNEDLVLYFLRKENFTALDAIFAYPAMQFANNDKLESLPIAVISSCLCKITKDNEPKVAQLLIDTFARNYNIGAGISGLIMLEIVFQASPNFGSMILQPALLASILEAIDAETESYRYRSLRLLSSATAIKELRVLFASECMSFLLSAHVSSRTQLLSILVMIKLMPVSEVAKKEILAKTNLLEQVKDALGVGGENAVITLEGLSYLSLYPSIMESIANDSVLINLLKLNCSKEDSSVYAVCTIFNHLTTFPKVMTEEEIQVQKLHELAQSTPPNNTLDQKDAVNKRIQILVGAGIIAILVQIKTDSKNLMECISNTLLSISINPSNRVLLIKGGACILLLKLFNSLLQLKGDYLVPAHALAKISITTNPFLAFKGEMAIEVIKPLMLLIACPDGLCQFEALLGLTNLAGSDNRIRTRIIQLDGLSISKSHQFSSHILTRRASTELLSNLVYHPVVFSHYLGKEGATALRVMIALCDDEDFETRRAASGCIAILSSEPDAIPMLVSSTRFFDICANLMTSGHDELVHRVSEIIKNCFIDLTHSKLVPAEIIKRVGLGVNHANPSISSCCKEIIFRAKKFGISV